MSNKEAPKHFDQDWQKISFSPSYHSRHHHRQPSVGSKLAGNQSSSRYSSSLKAKGIENFFQLSDRFYSGSAPEGDEAFAELKKLGVKTIITVDGAKPDVETAHHFGIRYVHLPIGYDGVPTNQAIRIVKAAETLPGPIYIHCHHGMHRGPAGAAVVCMAAEGWSAEEADSWLRVAGTATNYAGLYKSVEQFHVPTAEALKKVSANFPEQSEVSPLADVMIQIDGRLDNLKLIKKAGYRARLPIPTLAPHTKLCC